MRVGRRVQPAVLRKGAMRLLTMAASLAVLGGMPAVGSGAVAAAAPAGGVVNVFGVPNGGAGTILLTGAIGDYGKVQRQTASGAPNRNGNYVKFILKQGTLVGNGTALFAKLNNATPAFNKATCSGAFSASAPMPLSSGAGLYAGIRGTLNARVTFAFVGSRYKSGKRKGQCNTSQNSTPLAEVGSISGRGNVSFG